MPFRGKPDFMIRKALIFLCLMYQGFFVEASDGGRFLNGGDSIYIKPFSNRPQLTFEFARRTQQFDLVNPANQRQIVSYQPNTRVNFLGTLDYRWLSLSLGIFSFGAAEHKKKGETEQFALRFSINGRRIWNSNVFQLFQGYYLSNPQNNIPNWNSQAEIYPQRPDIFTFTWFSNLYYCFSPQRFSYRAALSQLEQQKQSGGSFIAGLSYRFNLISSDESQSMIPSVLAADFQPQNRAVALRQSTFTFHGGYVHSFVNSKDLFLTLYFLPGIAIESGAYLPEDKILRIFNSEGAFATEFRFITGYNGDTWFGGLSLHSIAFAGNRSGELWVNTSMGSVRLFCGYRFREIDRTKTPRFLRAIGL